jgi:hypothetical protein
LIHDSPQEYVFFKNIALKSLSNALVRNLERGNFRPQFCNAIQDTPIGDIAFDITAMDTDIIIERNMSHSINWDAIAAAPAFFALHFRT